MRVLITGICGQLGHDVTSELLEKNIEVFGIDNKINNNVDSFGNRANISKVDITNFEEIYEYLKEIKPDVIMHFAAWTAVDSAELEENREIVKLINEVGTYNLVKSIRNLDCKFLYISSDYVFDGKGIEPWRTTETVFNPVNYYGKTKLAAEKIVKENLNKYFIVRTEWLYGNYGNNFINTLINLSSTQKEIQVVDDQIGIPTYTKDLACFLVELINSEKYGIYHATNSGEYISWYDFSLAINELFRLNLSIKPCKTSEYKKSKAIRPLNSRLDTSELEKNGFKTLPTWRDALQRYYEIEEKKWDK